MLIVDKAALVAMDITGVEETLKKLDTLHAKLTEVKQLIAEISDSFAHLTIKVNEKQEDA